MAHCAKEMFTELFSSHLNPNSSIDAFLMEKPSLPDPHLRINRTIKWKFHHFLHPLRDVIVCRAVIRELFHSKRIHCSVARPLVNVRNLISVYLLTCFHQQLAPIFAPPTIRTLLSCPFYELKCGYILHLLLITAAHEYSKAAYHLHQ